MFASVAAGGGHNTVRDALMRAVEVNDPHQRIIRPQSWTATHGFDRIYRFCVRFGIQGLVFWFSSFSLSTWLLGLPFNPALLFEVLRTLRRSKPDVVVSTHLVLTAAIKLAVWLEGLPTRLVAVIPDYGTPKRGFFPRFRFLRADYTFVNGDDTYGALTADHTSLEGEVQQVGTVVNQAFVTVGQQRIARGLQTELRQAWLGELLKAHPEVRRLDATKPTVTFLGGSGFSGRTLPVIRRLLERSDAGRAFNVVVLCGRDDELLRSLQVKFSDRPGLLALGFVSHEALARVYGLTDVPVLGSLAHSTLHEMLETSTGPLLVFNVIPGTEPPYLDYLRRHALGLYEPRAEPMVELVEEGLGLRPGTQWAAIAKGFAGRARRVRDASVQRSVRILDQLLMTVGRKPAQQHVVVDAESSR
jgi:processive 1,2-diacylglycerol beta-glucosyltransferase